ncbi:GH25 family lysozyme [Enterococcus sp. AZ109]|uniref:GH25 family lysozyme n=1 Tax=Enterococcus sp. AZ109 TaxID=2774634 RepID=UPI003F1F9E5D
MKKRMLGLSFIAVLCLNLTTIVFAESFSDTNSSEQTAEMTAADEGPTIQPSGTMESTIETAENFNAETTQETTVEESDQSEDAQEQAENINPSEITTEEGTFYLPQGRSDLAPSLFRSVRASLPTVQASDNNTPTKSFIDVSSHNGTISVAAYQSMKNYGVTGVVVKLTEATSYRNPYAASQINNAKAAGLKVSAYHYSWFKTDDQARAEADYFASYANSLGLSKSALMVNDIEEPQILGQGDHSANSKAFAARLNQLGFGNVRHYVGLHWITSGRINTGTLGNKNIWVAAYPYTLSQTNYYTQYGAWQWSSQLRFPNVNGNFDISADYTGDYINEEPTAPSGYSAMYRLYNPDNGEHFYTASAKERDDLVRINWGKYEGIGWYAPNSGANVYRLYNPGLRDHHYTMSWDEVTWLTKNYGWNYEGVSWKSDTSDKTKVYRLFHPYMTSGSHHYTMSWDEVTWLTKNHGWKYEGIAWYGQ